MKTFKFSTLIAALIVALASLLYNPSLYAFDPGDIIITCGDKEITCFRYVDDGIDITIKGGITSIEIE